MKKAFSSLREAYKSMRAKKRLKSHIKIEKRFILNLFSSLNN